MILNPWSITQQIGLQFASDLTSFHKAIHILVSEVQNMLVTTKQTLTILCTSFGIALGLVLLKIFCYLSNRQAETTYSLWNANTWVFNYLFLIFYQPRTNSFLPFDHVWRTFPAGSSDKSMGTATVSKHGYVLFWLWSVWSDRRLRLYYSCHPLFILPPQGSHWVPVWAFSG